MVSFAIVLTLRPARDRQQKVTGGEVIPVGALLRVPGLAAVVIAGVIMVSASDIILIYVPLLGAERHIDVQDIGLLLTVRAAASMVARLFYARMVGLMGRWPLMTISCLVCAATYVAFAVALPLWAMHLVIAVMGLSFGLATTLSITIVVDMTTPAARGTANSLRIMGNRIGQFVLPFGAGLVAAAAGLAGLFLIIAAAIGVSAAAMVWKRPAR
jgi:MFS family permease